MVIPNRSLEQRKSALERANVIRTFRAELKRELHAGARHFEELYSLEECRTMKVREALLALPKVGPRKADRGLKAAGVSPSKTFAGMSDRQRRDLASALTQHLGPVTVEVNAPTTDDYDVELLEAALEPLVADGTIDRELIDELIASYTPAPATSTQHLTTQERPA